MGNPAIGRLGLLLFAQCDERKRARSGGNPQQHARSRRAFDGGPNQQWRFDAGKDGNALIISRLGKTLDIPGGTSSGRRTGPGLRCQRRLEPAVYFRRVSGGERHPDGPGGGFGGRPAPDAGPITCASDDGRRVYCEPTHAAVSDWSGRSAALPAGKAPPGATMRVASGWTGAAGPNLKFRAKVDFGSSGGGRGALLQPTQIRAGLSAEGPTARLSLRGPREALRRQRST